MRRLHHHYLYLVSCCTPAFPAEVVEESVCHYVDGIVVAGMRRYQIRGSVPTPLPASSFGAYICQRPGGGQTISSVSTV